MSVCPQCHEPKQPHRVCPNCGFYGDHEVIVVEQKKK
jgi:large subunit ribosomal protein L32